MHCQHLELCFSRAWTYQNSIKLAVGYILVVLSAICCVNSDAKVQAHELRLSRFSDVLSTVMSASDVEQREFIIAALEVMIDAYRVEIKRIDEHRGRTDKQSSWRNGTLAYVHQLEKTLNSAVYGDTIFIAQESDGSVRFIVGQQQIMFHAPRLEAQSGMEASLVEQFCLREYCARTASTVEERARGQMDNFAGSWEFSSKSKPTYSAEDGLQCVFKDQRHLTLKRQACKSLIYELRFLAEAMKSLRAKGARIDWDRVILGKSRDSAPNKLIYNRQQQYFNARLPNLFRSPALFRQSIPWLQTRSLGNVRAFVIEPPDGVTYSGVRGED